MRKSMLLSVCAWLIALSSFAQTTPVTGKVLDDKGAPVSGASVLEKGTKNGTTTGPDGSFSLKTKPGATLVVSGLGFENKQIAASSSNLMVELAPDVKALSEVVVTGTGVATSKRKLGFNVESVTSGKLPVIPSATLDQALVGKVAGAQISSVSGNPGDPVNIVLRGINTVQGGTRPLIMMDGVEIPFGNLNSLDLSQVDRVEVVKGAASATLYGAQGANGVIQIFTKKGKSGTPSITFSTTYLTSALRKKLNVNQSPTKFGGPTDGPGALTQDIITAPFQTTTTAVTRYDYQDYIFRNANGTDNNISVSGGTDKTKYYLSGSYFYNQGIIQNTSFQRYSFRSNVDQVINKWASKWKRN